MKNEYGITPGPWHEGAGNGTGSIFGPEGTRRDNGGLSPIAIVNGARPEDDANARAITRVPEMIALLEQVPQWLDKANEKMAFDDTCLPLTPIRLSASIRALLASLKGVQS